MPLKLIYLIWFHNYEITLRWFHRSIDRWFIILVFSSKFWILNEKNQMIFGVSVWYYQNMLYIYFFILLYDRLFDNRILPPVIQVMYTCIFYNYNKIHILIIITQVLRSYKLFFFLSNFKVLKVHAFFKTYILYKLYLNLLKSSKVRIADNQHKMVH